MAKDRPVSDLLDPLILKRPEGQLAYDLRGEGPLIICTPAPGDLRSSFSAFATRLAREGYCAATADLRGHGESSVGWESYTGPQIADDLLALAGQLSPQHSVVLAASGGSAAAAIVLASFRPERVAALILFNPDIASGPARRGLLERLSGWPVVGRKLWMRHWRNLHVRRLDDLGARQSQLDAKLAEPGRFQAVMAMLESSSVEPMRDEATKGANAFGLLPHVTCPVLVMMGEDDPGAAQPALDAQAIVENLGGPARVLLVPDVGHFPQAEVPEVAASQTITFLRAYL